MPHSSWPVALYMPPLLMECCGVLHLAFGDGLTFLRCKTAQTLEQAVEYSILPLAMGLHSFGARRPVTTDS